MWSGAPWVRKVGNLPIREILVIVSVRPTDRPSTPQAYECRITQPTGMATQMKLEVILVGNCIATHALWSRDN